MRKICFYIVVGLLLLPAIAAAAETFKDVPVVDSTAPKKSRMRRTTTLASVRSSVKPAAMAS